jgi:hypothetical protein
MYVCMYVCVYVFMCVCAYVRTVRMHACMYVCMYVYVCVCMYVFMCVCVCILLYRTLYTVAMFVPTSALKSTISVSYLDTGAGILFGWWWRTCAKIPFIETMFQV